MTEGMLFEAVSEVMRRFGEGEITTQEAAEAVRPAYDYALNERAQRTWESNLRDPDDASTPTAFIRVAVAHQTEVITPEQYEALVGVLLGRG